MTSLISKMKWVILVGGDVAILYVALWIMLRIRFGDPLSTGAWQEHFFPFTALYGAWFLLFYIFGLYDLKLAKINTDFYIRLAKTLGTAFVATIIFFYLTPFFGIAPKTNLFLITAFVFFLLILWRHLYNIFVKYPLPSHHILVIGHHPQVEELQNQLQEAPQLGYVIAAVVHSDHKEISFHLSLKGPIRRVLTAFDPYSNQDLVKFLFTFAGKFTFESFASFYERITEKVPLSQISEIWFLENLKEEGRDLYNIGKRTFDILIGLLLGFVTLGLLPFIALAIKLESSGPVFYSHPRVGKNGKLFQLIKFRSMIENAEQEGAVWAQQRDPRITNVGKILRKTFLDEFPQCINILKGEMSVIGPRPERIEFVTQLEKEIPFYQIRHIIKPGITGWAQVHAPYGNSTPGALEKLQYDLYYIKNRSPLLDLKTLLKTINVIFKGGTQ